MKRGYLVITFLVLVSLNTACVIRDASISPDERIHGSGNLITETRNLPDFRSVNMTTAGKVNITYGTEQAASVTVDDNLVEHITTKVSHGKLVIGIEPNVQLSNLHLTVNLTMTDLEELMTSSAGSIEGQNRFEADFVSLVLSSAGHIILELQADELSSNLSSAGSLFLSGSIKEHQATVSSAGNLHAFNLLTETTKITVSSAGNAEVYASGLLDATISSTGSVYYKGNPTIHQTITSLGRLINAN